VFQKLILPNFSKEFRNELENNKRKDSKLLTENAILLHIISKFKSMVAMQNIRSNPDSLETSKTQYIIDESDMFNFHDRKMFNHVEGILDG
jgi:hypothetical protein